MLRSRSICSDKGEINIVSRSGGQRDFGFFTFLFQPLKSHRVACQIDAIVLLELNHHPIDDGLVPDVASQHGVAIGRFDLEDTIANLEDGNVKRTSS